MAKDLFNVPIFFIIFRKSYSLAGSQPDRLTRPGETVDAVIIVSVLLAFVEQLMSTGRLGSSSRVPSTHDADSATLLDTEPPAAATISVLRERDSEASSG